LGTLRISQNQEAKIMSIKLLPAMALSLLFGFLLGSIPVVNEHLHWNLWFVIPISGLIIGALIGCLQFGISYPLNQKIGGWDIPILAVAAMIGYVAVDYGIYLATTITVTGVEGITDGEHKLSELITFIEYMKWMLGSSSVSTRHGTEIFEMGSIGTAISYIIDVVGAFLGAAGTLFLFSEKYPFCDRCEKFKKRESIYEIFFNYQEDMAKTIFTKIAELIEKSDYKEMLAYCRDLSEKYSEKNGDVKIFIDQRFCPVCHESSIIGKVFRGAGKEWKEIDELSFSFTSQPGEHTPLNA